MSKFSAYSQQKEKKIFLNNMNSLFSNILIENLRTEHNIDAKTIRSVFMGTVNSSNSSLPYLFKPEIVNIEINCHFESKVFTNDIYILDLHDDYNDLEFIIKGLRHLRHDEEKILVLISSPLTWGKTNPKYKVNYFINNKSIIERIRYNEFRRRTRRER